LLPKEKKTNPN